MKNLGIIVLVGIGVAVIASKSIKAPQKPDKLLTLKEMAQRFGYDPDRPDRIEYMLELIKTGTVKAINKDGVVYAYESSLQKYLDRDRNQGRLT